MKVPESITGGCLEKASLLVFISITLMECQGNTKYSPKLELLLTIPNNNCYNSDV